MSDDAVIDIQGLSVGFTGRSGATLPVLRDVSLTVRRGESVGIVGESGCGKSTVALAAMGYLKQGLRRLDGQVRFKGADMFDLPRAELEAIRGGQMGLVPQNSGQALTPTMRVGRQMHEALRLHCKLPENELDPRAIELLSQVRLPDPEAIMRRFPHELSGGQQQRVAIAMALAGEPEAMLLDEPTTGLDVTTQAHILELLRDLAAERQMAMVFVSHDLGVIARSCERVAVMYAGEIVLEGPARAVLRDPPHPYPRALLESIPRVGDPCLPVALEGRPPAPGAGLGQCAFSDRCVLADERCRTQVPEETRIAGDLVVRCFHHDKAADVTSGQEHIAPIHHSHDGEQALKLTDLEISYHRAGTWDRLFGRDNAPPATVADVNLTVTEGETIGLVGESGSGKSTILKAIAGLLAPSAGDIRVAGDTRLPDSVDRRQPEQLRRIQMVFQNPDESLNPRQTVAEIIAQPLRLYYRLHGHALRERSIEILESVRLGAHYMDRLPSQLSGGEKQRVAIARAFAADPEIVLCDEVTSALDVSVQAAVLELLDELKRSQNTTYLFVSHDLAVVRALSDRVAVLYQGRVCEVGPTEKVYNAPWHPYTEVLVNAVLEPDPDTAPKLSAEDVVELSPPARGCPFQRRCPRKLGAICDTDTPPWRDGGDEHLIRCHIAQEDL